MKTLVSDFDKTFFPDNYIDNIKEINTFVDLNNNFIIATGRNAKSLKQEIDRYNIKYDYLICNDGSVIYDKDSNVVKKITINRNTVEKLVDFVSMYFENIMLDDGFSLTHEISDDIDGIFIPYNDLEVANYVIKTINENFKEVHGYLSENYINIVDKDASKGNAIKYLQLLNNYQDIYVVGDGVNDISMYEMYKGFSLLNSIPELKELAHYHVTDFIDAVNALKNL